MKFIHTGFFQTARFLALWCIVAIASSAATCSVLSASAALPTGTVNASYSVDFFRRLLVFNPCDLATKRLQNEIYLISHP